MYAAPAGKYIWWRIVSTKTSLVSCTLLRTMTDGVSYVQRDGAGVKALHHGRKMFGKVRKVRRTGWILAARSFEAIDRRLRAAGHRQRYDVEVRRRNAFEHHAFDAAWMAASVVQIESRTVRSAEQDEFRIAQSGTHVV